MAMTMARARAPERALFRRLARLGRLAAEWSERARTRRDLLDLDDRALADIGLTRWDVRREAFKPFWRA